MVWFDEDDVATAQVVSLRESVSNYRNLTTTDSAYNRDENIKNLRALESVVEYVGSFKTKGKLLAMDPCYSSENDFKALSGKWLAATIKHEDNSWGRRIAQLVVRHESLKPGDMNIDDFKRQGTNIVGVDSGQAGFIDALQFSSDDYEKFCELTLSSRSAGCLDYAAVSSSGYGDGGYDLYVKYDKDANAVAAFIDFIPTHPDDIVEDDSYDLDGDEEGDDGD